MALTGDQIEHMYENAKGVHEGRLARTHAINALEQLGVSRERAADCLQNFRRMRQGERYTRTLTGSTTRYFLDRIYNDFGEDGLDRALSALWSHIEYLEPIRGGVCRQERLYHQHFSLRLSAVRGPVDPDEGPVDQGEQRTFVEGATKQVLVNRYERDGKARAACIRHWGCTCYVCGFDFQKTYGEMGRGFVHVHHLTDIASIGEEYEIDPIEDLRPVCPNCHAMLHTQCPALDIDLLKSMLTPTNGGQ